MTTKCVEPANAIGNLQYVVQTPQNDELLFPHVDSCLAIAFIMSNATYIGGHVGMQMPNSPNLDSHGNAMTIVAQMLALVQNANIDQVLLAGDRSIWRNDILLGRNTVQDIVNLTQCNHSLLLESGGFGGGIDFSLNPRRRMAFVKRCRGGGGRFALQLPFTRIVGHCPDLIIS